MPIILSRKGGGGGGGGAPSGPAGGDLTGTYPNPTIADGVLPPIAGKVIGAYYTTHMTGGATGNWQAAVPTVAASTMACMPIFLETGTLDRIAQQNFSTQAGETLRMGIYDNDDGIPGNLVLDAGTIDLSAGTGIKTITINQAVTRGLYWLASVKQGSNLAQVTVNAFYNAGHLIMPTSGPAGTNLYDVPAAWALAGVAAGLPAAFSGTATTAANGTDTIASPFVRYSA